VLQIDTLSRINHKNFVNLIGYCEEQEPFTRMLVFEYAPNGNVFEHLHGTTLCFRFAREKWILSVFLKLKVLYVLVADLERLDWSARIKIIMGIAYCLQYMHHDLNPPLAQSNLTSNMIFLTDDFSAKVETNHILFFCLFSIHVNIQVTHFSIPLFIHRLQKLLLDILCHQRTRVIQRNLMMGHPKRILKPIFTTLESYCWKSSQGNYLTRKNMAT